MISTAKVLQVPSFVMVFGEYMDVPVPGLVGRMHDSRKARSAGCPEEYAAGQHSPVERPRFPSEVCKPLVRRIESYSWIVHVCVRKGHHQVTLPDDPAE